MSNVVWIAGSDGVLRGDPIPQAGMALKDSVVNNWVAGSNGDVRDGDDNVVARVSDLDALLDMLAVESPVPLVNVVALKEQRDVLAGLTALALGRAMKRRGVLAGDLLAMRAKESKEEELDPKQCIWKTIHGHPVCIHPKSGYVAVPHAEQPTIQHFNKVQNDLFHQAMDKSADWIAGQITHTEAMVAKAKAIRKELKAKGNLTDEEGKQYVSAGAALSRGNQALEALTHAHNTKSGLTQGPPSWIGTVVEPEPTHEPVPAPIPEPIAPPEPVKPKVNGPEFSKTMYDQYKKVLTGLEQGKITPDTVEARNKELADIIAAKTAAMEGADAAEKKLIGAKISRSKQEITANTAALAVYSGVMTPAIMVGGEKLIAAIPIALPKLVENETPLTIGEYDAKLALNGLKTGLYTPTDVAKMIAEAKTDMLPLKAAAMQGALDSFLNQSAVSDVKLLTPGVLFSPYHYKVYQNALEALKDGSKSVEETLASIKYYHDKAATAATDSAMVFEGGKANALEAALAVYQGKSLPSLIGNKTTYVPPILPAGTIPELGPQLTGDSLSYYNSSLAKLQNGETTPAAMAAAIETLKKNFMPSSANAAQMALNDYTASTPNVVSALHPQAQKFYSAISENLAKGIVTPETIAKTIADEKKSSAYLEGSPTSGDYIAGAQAALSEHLASLAKAEMPAPKLSVYAEKVYSSISEQLAKGLVAPETIADAIAKEKISPTYFGGNMTSGDYLTGAQAALNEYTATIGKLAKPIAPIPTTDKPAKAPKPPEVPPSVLPATDSPIASAFVPLHFEAQPVNAPQAAVIKNLKLGTTLEYDTAAGGTQGASWYKDKEGSRYLVKSYTQPDRLATEVMANAVFRQLGIPIPEGILTEVDIKGTMRPAYTYKAAEGTLLGDVANLDKLSPAARAKFNNDFARGFIADALLGHRDVVGATGDNILVGKDGTAYRIDVGGTMFYRAQGEKKEFGPKVEELKTLLTAGGAGPVYAAAGLDEYTKQQAALQLHSRLTDGWIENMAGKAEFSDSMRKDVISSLKARRDTIVNFYRPVEQVTPKVVEAVEKMGIQGHGISVAGTAFKGATAQANFELSPTGQKQLVVYGKLRGAAEDELWSRIAPAVKGVPTQSKTSMQGGYADSYHTIIMTAAKTINHHKIGGNAPDNAFNQNSLNSFVSAVSGMDPDGYEYKHHEAAIKAINENLGYIKAKEFDKVKAVPLVQPAPEPPLKVEPKKKPKPIPENVGIKVTQLTSGSGAWIREHDPSGLSKRKEWASEPIGLNTGTAIHFDTSEVEGTYFPSGSKPNLNENPYSRQGYIEIRSKDGTQESLRAGMARLGIPNHDSTARDSEEAYLSRLAWWLKEEKSAPFVAAHAVEDAEERLIAKRAALSTLAGVKDITKTPEYNPAPKHDSRGTSYYEAPLIPGITDKMPSSLWHVLHAANWEATTNSMVGSGVHSLESTEARLRKGLFVSGMSSQTDQGKGSAGHLFFYFGDGGGGGSWTVDGRIMRRLDAYAFDFDAYGDLVSKADQRQKPGTFSKGHGSWQATIAGGVGFDYAKVIKVNSSTQRTKLLANLKKMGISHVGQAYKQGGIPIEDAVKVQ